MISARPDLYAIWAAKGQILYSIPPGTSKENLQPLHDIFDAMPSLKISCIPWHDFQRTRIKKLLMNAVINPITALLQVRNGTLLENEETISLARSIVEETCVAFRADLPDVMENGDMQAEVLYDEVMRNLGPMGANISSMCADVRMGKEETEM